MLEIRGISFKYNFDKTILNNINAEFEEGLIVAIQGKSGAGKSTLLTILSGLEDKYEGVLIYNGVEINQKNLRAYNKENVSMVFQNSNLIKYLSVKDNIMQGAIVKQKKVDLSLMNEYIKRLDLTYLDLNKNVAMLSGGEQQRIAILRALLSDTKIVLADEPTASLDSENTKKIINEFKYLAHELNKIVIIITHDNLVAKECDKVYKLSGGILK